MIIKTKIIQSALHWPYLPVVLILCPWRQPRPQFVSLTMMVRSKQHDSYMDTHLILFLFLVSPVTIGLQRTSYTVTEDDALVLVCTEVESGSIAGRSITVNYQTANNDAVGMYTLSFST